MPVCSLKCAAPSPVALLERRKLAAHFRVHHVADVCIRNHARVGGNVSEFGGSIPPNQGKVLKSADVSGHETRAEADDEDSRGHAEKQPSPLGHLHRSQASIRALVDACSRGGFSSGNGQTSLLLENVLALLDYPRRKSQRSHDGQHQNANADGDRRRLSENSALKQ